MSEKTKKPFYKKWWFILIAVVFVMGGIGSIFESDEKKQEREEERIAAEKEREEKSKAKEKEKEKKKERKKQKEEEFEQAVKDWEESVKEKTLDYYREYGIVNIEENPGSDWDVVNAYVPNEYKLYSKEEKQYYVEEFGPMLEHDMKVHFNKEHVHVYFKYQDGNDMAKRKAFGGWEIR